jgi:hypothetical protein
LLEEGSDDSARRPLQKSHFHGGSLLVRGQGLIVQLSMDNTHSRTALLFLHHLARRCCNRAIGRKGGTILSRSPALHHLKHPGEDFVASLLGQHKKGKALRNPVPRFWGSWAWLTVSVVRYGFTARCETDLSGSMEPDVPITTPTVHTGLGFIRS